MAEPGFTWEVNSGTEVTPTWQPVGTDVLRWTGPGGIGDPMPAPVSGANWFDNTTPPNDGEFWLDGAIDYHVTLAGRNTNRNVLRITENLGNPTVDPPEFTAYDDAAQAAARGTPTKWPMTGTAVTSNVSTLRAVETTTAAPGAGWTGQTHNAEPGEGSSLKGETNKLTFAAAYGGSDSKTLNLAHCAPSDVPTGGITSFVYSLQYTYT